MNDKGCRALIVQLEAQGWTVSHTHKTHWKAVPPPGLVGRDGTPAALVFLPFTPSDYRALKNCRSLLRRQGADL